MPEPGADQWFAVRCLFRSPDASEPDLGAYEERITVWRAPSFEAAIARAESEATVHAALLEEMGMTRLEFSQCYMLAVEGVIEDGDEVFSLIRDSELSPTDYIARHFDTGTEYQGQAT